MYFNKENYAYNFYCKLSHHWKKLKQYNYFLNKINVLISVFLIGRKEELFKINSFPSSKMQEIFYSWEIYLKGRQSYDDSIDETGHISEI
jgi:hypothetical protein